MVEKEIKVKYTVFNSIDELSKDDAFLIAKAREASLNSWAPYSHFNVGSAVKLENGIILTGSNQENAAYPTGLCAERVALFYANSSIPDLAVVSLAISASKTGNITKNPIMPCGSCRQAILESEIRFNKKVRLLLDGTDEIVIVEGIENLLPLSFSNSDL